MPSNVAPGSRVHPTPHRLQLGWGPPVGTVLTPAADDLFAADVFTGVVPFLDSAAGSAGGWVAVRWDGHRRPEWVDPADLIPAAASAAAVA